jgi:hypothetical protein
MGDYFKSWQRVIYGAITRAPRGIISLPRYAYVLASAVLCLVCGLSMLGHPARTALPFTASEGHEYASPYYGVQMDYYYLLKARMTENQFADYVVRLKLSPLKEIPSSRRSFYHWHGFENSTRRWWNPTNNIANSYHDTTTRGSMVVLAKYEMGYLYYQDCCGY